MEWTIAVATTVILALSSFVFPLKAQVCEPQMAANETSEFANITLLSDRYIPDVYSSALLGEVTNNGNGTALIVYMNAYFYDKNHELIGFLTTTTDPLTVGPGERSAFKFDIYDGSVIESVIENGTATYELLTTWTDDLTCQSYHHRFVPS